MGKRRDLWLKWRAWDASGWCSHGSGCRRRPARIPRRPGSPFRAGRYRSADVQRPFVLKIPRYYLPAGAMGDRRGLGATTSTYTAAQIQQMIVAAANAQGVPPALALGVAAHESGFQPDATNYNANGTTDFGVMQLNSSTVQTLGISDPMDPQTNINAGVSLLAKYLQQYGGDQSMALWAYASGPGAVAAGGAPNSTAQNFINFVTGYTPDASLDLTGAAAPASLDDSGDSAGGIDLSALGIPTGSIDPVTIAAIAVIGGLVLYLLVRPTSS